MGRGHFFPLHAVRGRFGSALILPPVTIQRRIQVQRGGHHGLEQIRRALGSFDFLLIVDRQPPLLVLRMNQPRTRISA